MGPPSPIPPGKHTQVMHYRGYKFSAEENAFAIEYGKILVERNHEVSMSAVSNAIYLKVRLWYISCVVSCANDRIAAAAPYAQIVADPPPGVSGLRYRRVAQARWYCLPQNAKCKADAHDDAGTTVAGHNKAIGVVGVVDFGAATDCHVTGANDPNCNAQYPCTDSHVSIGGGPCRDFSLLRSR